ncbi:DUF2334 domain-containing protein [Oceanobacillus picturae]|uniref:DUF2334 domain-containing protein n=1 Tax=Oceanobacillus picturae TaxID=171693 RepID=UPI0036275ED1
MHNVRYVVSTLWKLTIVTVCVCLIFQPLSIKAQEKQHVLVVLPSNNEQAEVHQHLLDMLIGHFTTNITFKKSEDVQANDVKDTSYIFYYGAVKEKLPSSFIELINESPQQLVVIGYNAEQLMPDSNFKTIAGDTSFTSILYNQSEYDVEQQEFVMVQDDQNVNILVEAVNEQGTVPLFTQKGRAWYYASANLFSSSSNILSEVLHEVFEVDHQDSRQAYLRLEDIHPGVDAKKLERIGEFLKEENIPYLASISPVYINPETEEIYTLSDTPDVVKVLQGMQENGASFVLHGYADQYGEEETGSGFEFWDKEANKPLEEHKKTAYSGTESFIKHATLREKLEAGIQELVDYKLLPIAFEAPHYAMSQQGYETIAEYFSTYVGQVQLSDKDWRMMTEAPVQTKPKFLHGMTLLPETIRYVRYDEPDSITEMQEKMEDMQIVRDGVIGGFYHPFMGIEQLKKLVQEMQDIPGVTWLDVKEGNHSVHMEDYTIQTDQQGVKLIPASPDKNDETSEEASFLPTFRMTVAHLGWIGLGFTLTGLVVFISFYRADRGIRPE